MPNGDSFPGLLDSSSILESIKVQLNISPDDLGFDQEVKDLINAEFLPLQQLGLGPEAGFSIESSDEVWDDFTEDRLLQNTVRQYIYLRVRMIFDPPASSVVAEAINGRIAELTFRLNSYVETGGASVQ